MPSVRLREELHWGQDRLALIVGFHCALEREDCQVAHAKEYKWRLRLVRVCKKNSQNVCIHQSSLCMNSPKIEFLASLDTSVRNPSDKAVTNFRKKKLCAYV